MALRENTTRIQFSGGIERKMGEQSVPTVRLLALEDAVFTKAVSLTKRNGYEALSQAVLGSPTPYDCERGLAVRGSELILFTEGSSLSYIEGASAWSTIPDGVMSIRQSDRGLVKTISNQTSCDYAEADGIAMVCWEDSRGGVYYAVMDAGSGRVTIPPTLAASNGSRPRAVRTASTLVVLWSTTGGDLFSIMVNPLTPHTATVVQPVVGDLAPTLPNFDATYETSSSGGAVLTWNAVTGVRVGWLAPSGLLGTAATGWAPPVTLTTLDALTAGPVVSTVPGESGKTWAVAWSEKQMANAALLQAELTISTVFATSDDVGFQVDRIAVAARDLANSTPIDVWCEDRDSTVRLSSVLHKKVTVAGVWSSATRATYRSMCLASSGWTDVPTSTTTRNYVMLLHSTPLQSSFLTVRDDGLLVAQTIPGNAGDEAGHRLPRVTCPSDDRVYKLALTFKAKLDALNNNVFTESGPRLVTLDFDAADAYQTVYVGRTLYLGGAVTQVYDGVSWVEAMPIYAPDWEVTETLHTSSAAGTGGMTAGTRNYKFWYEATLANGEIVRGPVSKPYQVVVAGADDRVVLLVPTLTLSAWGRGGGTRENLRVCAARTVDGDAAAYYRITSLDPSTAGAVNGYVANTQSADSVTVTDDLSDADLVLREPLYTTGGIPSNDAVGTSGVIFEGKGRIFVGASSNANAVYFSQEQAEGYVMEFTPELVIVVPPYGGAVTGGVVMDDRVVLTKETALYQVTGTGPLADPTQGGSWASPESIASDGGCIDQRTIAVFDKGAVFKSRKGPYMIDRGLQVSYVGAPVEAFNDLTITRSTTVEDATQIRFLTSDGRALLFDYLFGQWSTFQNHQGLDAVVVDGVYHYLRTDGRVFRETAGEHADELQPVAMAIATAWITPSEARQGLMHVWTVQVLGVWKSAHTLNVQWMFDYDETDNWSEPVTFNATDMAGGDYGDGNYGDGDYGGATPARYQWEVFIGRTCQAIRFRFTFPEAAGTFGACAELTELRLTFGVFGNLNKLPAERMG
jgi:hypothetical protein